MKVLMWLSVGLDSRTPSEHLLSAIANALLEKGCIVHILQKGTGGNKPTLPRELDDMRITTTVIRQYKPIKRNLLTRYLLDVHYVRKCDKFLQEKHDYECVFIQSSNVAGLQSEILKKRLPYAHITFNIQDIFPENAVYCHKMKTNGILYSFFSRIQKKAYDNVDRIITISEDMKAYLIDLGVNEEKIDIIYNWSYQDYEYDPLTTRANQVDAILSADNFHVVYAGNIGIMQNVDSIIHAAKLLRSYKEIRFDIIGNGSYRDKLERYTIKEKLKNVSFHDMLSTENAPAIYCRADVNIIPLAENIFRTALPSKTATCLACQKPVIFVIGTDSLFGKAVQQATGAPVLDSNDARGLAKTILDFYNHKLNYHSADYFRLRFQKSKNSSLYADIIINKLGKTNIL